jgi:hypothetical protein
MFGTPEGIYRALCTFPWARVVSGDANCTAAREPPGASIAYRATAVASSPLQAA